MKYHTGVPFAFNMEYFPHLTNFHWRWRWHQRLLSGMFECQRDMYLRCGQRRRFCWGRGRWEQLAWNGWWWRAFLSTRWSSEGDRQTRFWHKIESSWWRYDTYTRRWLNTRRTTVRRCAAWQGLASPSSPTRLCENKSYENILRERILGLVMVQASLWLGADRPERSLEGRHEGSCSWHGHTVDNITWPQNALKAKRTLKNVIRPEPLHALLLFLP